MSNTASSRLLLDGQRKSARTLPLPPKTMNKLVKKVSRREPRGPKKDVKNLYFEFLQCALTASTAYRPVGKNDGDDERASISTVSTNATADNLPGAGRIIDMWIYQFLGRKIERLANRVTMSRLPPARIVQCLGRRIPSLNDFYVIYSISSVIEHIHEYPEHPGGGGVVVAGLKSLVRQTKSNNIYRSSAALAALVHIAASGEDYARFVCSVARSESIFHAESLARKLNEPSPVRKQVSLLACLLRRWPIYIFRDPPPVTPYEGDRLWPRFIELLDSYKAQLKDGDTRFDSAENSLFDILLNGCILYFECIDSTMRVRFFALKVLNFNEKSAFHMLYYLIIFLVHCIALQYQQLAKAGDAAHLPRMVLFQCLRWIEIYSKSLITTTAEDPATFKSKCKFTSVRYALKQYGYFTSDENLYFRGIDKFPKRNGLEAEYPSIIKQHIQEWIPRTLRLFFSLEELDREARETALLTRIAPLSGRHWAKYPDEELSRSRKRARQHLARHMGVSEDVTKSLTESRAEGKLVDVRDSAGRVYAVEGDLNLVFVQSLVNEYGDDGISKWAEYKERSRWRHEWGEYLRSNLDWDWDVASSLKHLFKQPKSCRRERMRRQAGPQTTIVADETGERKLDVSVDDPHPNPPKTVEVKRKNAAGKIEYFRYVLEPVAKVAGDKCSLQVSDEAPADSIPTTTSGSLVANGVVVENGAGDGTAGEAEEECVSEDSEDKQSVEDQGRNGFDMDCTPVDFLSRGISKTISGHLERSVDRTEMISQWIAEVE